MIISAAQAQGMLGVGKTRFLRIVADGSLKPVNERKKGAKKWFMRFESADVNRLKKASQPARNNGHVVVTELEPLVTDYVTTRAVPAASGLLTRLATIEDKLDRLLAIWS
jgi:hypothetical protein